MKQGMKRLINAVLALSISLIIMAGCAGGSKDMSILNPIENWVSPQYDYSFYDNFQFNQFYNPEVSAQYLPNQWKYGMGNAFVMRWNGWYYMYINGDLSTPALPAWKSQDLMIWEEVDNGVLQKGHIIEDPRVNEAYPPCVYYYDGLFYMFIYLKNSRNNLPAEGNYILISESPEGPFEFVDKNNDGQPDVYTPGATLTDIDSDIFVDDDGTTWFMSASSNGIRIHKMGYGMDEIFYGPGDTWILDQTSVGGWTEGSNLFKRDGKYYIGYTGSNILSPGYLTAYSTALNDDWKNPVQNIGYGFEQGIDWPLGVKTEDTFRSLGHFSSLLGPDMDGIYYHYFNVNSAGPNCSFNIDRLIFNGAAMDAAQLQFGSVKPKLPQIRTYSPEKDFVSENGALLSAASTGTMFTAEFNYIGNSIKCVFGHVDKDNYWYVKADIPNKSIKLYQVKNGAETEKGAGTLNRPYSPGKLETIRVAYRDGRADVYFSDLCKIDNIAVSIPAGKIGYIGDGIFFYTAASNVAFGASDQLEPKHYSINIGAASYLPQGLMQGYGSILGEGSGYSEVTAEEYGGQYVGLGKMTLSNWGDCATFVVNFDEDRTAQGKGLFGLVMTYGRNQGGKTIGVRVDGGKLHVVKLPEVNPSDEHAQIVKALVCDLPISRGIHQISIVRLDDDVSFHSISFTKTSDKVPSYSASLDKAPQKGMEVMTLWRYQTAQGDTAPSLYTKSGRSLVYFGDDTLTDYTVEVEFKFESDDYVNSAGVILRASNYSNSAYYSENYKYIQGYYVAFNLSDFGIEKLNYTHSNENAAFTNINLQAGAWHKLKVEIRDNTINATIMASDGKQKSISFTDDIAFNSGRFGLYTDGASVYYRNLVISK